MEVSNDTNRAIASAEENFQAVAEDTFISPYNSPQKSYDNGSGDFSSINQKGVKSQHSIATNSHSVPPENHSKGSVNFESDILKELEKVSQNNERNCIYGGDGPQSDCIKSDSGIALTDEKQTESADENHDETQNGFLHLQVEKLETVVQSENLNSPKSEHSNDGNVPSPEEQKDKFIAEMLATAAETTSNDQLTESEMVSISKKMEEEFRSMVFEDRQKKKLMMEGASFASPLKDLPDTVENSKSIKPKTKQSSEVTISEAKRTTKTTHVSRLPTTQSKIARPSSARKSTAPNTTSTKKGPTASPNRQRTASPTKPKSTPTTIRITPKATSSISSGEQRTPLQPTALRIKTQTRTPSGNTPLKATQPATLRSPRSAPVTRTPFSDSSTPRRRTPSSQSSESGRSRMPDTKNAQSKIGSLQNARHTPGGGNVKIESRRVDYRNVGSRCGSMANTKHTPGGGKVKIESKKLDFSHVTSKCGSMDNVTHTPGGGRVKVESKKLDYSKTASKCGSKDNLKHTPQGGNVKIFHTKVDTRKVQSKIGSKDNMNHTPGGGKVKIVSRSMDLSNVKSKCGSLENAHHTPGGGNVQIFDETPAFKETAQARIGSLENATHISGGGDVRIYNEKLQFKETAAPRTDTGFNGLGSQDSSGSVDSK